MSASPPAPRTSIKALLRRGPFARYMAGETVSMLGTWMQQMAQGWVLAGLGTSALTLSAVSALSTLCMVSLSLWGGAVADRHDKRIVLAATLLAQALLAVAVGWLVAHDQILLWHIAIAGILLGSTAAFEMPAAAALVPELVSKEEIPAALAIDRAVFNATRLAGPAVGGALISLLGTAAAFYANACSYLALIAALFTIAPRSPKTQTPETPEEQKEQKKQEGIGAGWRHVRSDGPTFTMLLLIVQTTTFISPFFMILIPVYSRRVLMLDAGQHGMLMAASGCGALLGSLHLLRIAREHRLAYLRAAAAAVTVAMITVSLAPGLWVAIPALTLLTLGTSTIFGVANTLIQERAPDRVRGRVSALAGMSFSGVLTIAGLLAAGAADVFDLRSAMCAGGVCFALGASLLLKRNILRESTATAHPPPSAGPAEPLS